MSTTLKVTKGSMQNSKEADGSLIGLVKSGITVFDEIDSETLEGREAEHALSLPSMSTTVPICIGDQTRIVIKGRKLSRIEIASNDEIQIRLTKGNLAQPSTLEGTMHGLVRGDTPVINMDKDGEPLSKRRAKQFIQGNTPDDNIMTIRGSDDGNTRFCVQSSECAVLEIDPSPFSEQNQMDDVDGELQVDEQAA